MGDIMNAADSIGISRVECCCLGGIRTPTGGTRIRRATITPQDNLHRLTICDVSPDICRSTGAKLRSFFLSPKFGGNFFVVFLRRCTAILTLGFYIAKIQMGFRLICFCIFVQKLCHADCRLSSVVSSVMSSEVLRRARRMLSS